MSKIYILSESPPSFVENKTQNFNKEYQVLFLFMVFVLKNNFYLTLILNLTKILKQLLWYIYEQSFWYKINNTAIYKLAAKMGFWKKRKINEIWKNKNAKGLKILLFTHPDVDDLIKDTFFFDTPDWPRAATGSQEITLANPQSDLSHPNKPSST